MAKCKAGKCGCKTRIVSNVVQNMQGNCNCDCLDVCSNPIIDCPKVLSIMAPLIYDEIGINLCTTFDLGTDVLTTYPTAVSAVAKVLDITFTYGTDAVSIEAITGRANCYAITLSNLVVQFAINLYDDNCRLLGTIFPTATYLPPVTTAATYDEDTNPTSVELEIFAPYGVSYTPGASTDTFTPIINYLGYLDTNNYVTQGLNLYAIPKVLDFDIDDNTVTVGLTLVLQSLYFAGYRVDSAGKINTPKGTIETSENTSCMQFVAGDLLNLAIKPLELGPPACEERFKQSCADNYSCSGAMIREDETVVLPGI